ncbi:DoxX family membrane protein [Thermomicrobiaceae bacterium CFH 74404]|uniref:DoxX family membrane protein n=1 Tax=Thermalbibacter longus TaxID=2951981 RepID=A0AA42BC86_9BACT|nr:DoxX family membrane protein [Thermalbibacter longus]MCM8748518.1 DoxX family membrane protein [Thermalbibacter longus]
MDWVFLIGRLVFGLFFVLNGINHFAQLRGMSAYAASKGVPAPQAAVIVTGLLLLLGGLSIATGYQPVVGAVLLVVFLVPVAFIMHNFWAETDPMSRANQMAHFLKNLALAGAALALMYVPTPWPLSLG